MVERRSDARGQDDDSAHLDEGREPVSPAMIAWASRAVSCATAATDVRSKSSSNGVDVRWTSSTARPPMVRWTARAEAGRVELTPVTGSIPVGA
jgi:hypothetical protein